MSLIKIEHVSKYYSDGTTSSKGIEDINLTFDKGEFVAITGESGSGKTTLLNTITLMDNYDEGDITFNDKSTADFTDKEIKEFRREYVSFVFQEYNLFQSLTPLSNLIIALRNRGYKHKEALEIAKRRLTECGLESRMHERVARLSGGERQRVVIARALAINSPVIAFDEPTGNLDSKTSEEIIKLIDKIKANHLILFVTHEYDLIKDLATRHITMKDGHVEKDEILREKYLSEESEENISIKKPSFSSTLYSSIQIIISSPKKFILTCLAQILLAFAAIGVSFGFAFCADRIQSDIESNISSAFEPFTNNLIDQSILVVNNDNTFDINVENAIIDNTSALNYLNFSLRYETDNLITLSSSAVASLTKPQSAKVIEQMDIDTPSFQVFYNEDNLTKLESDDYKAFFSYALKNQIPNLLRLENYTVSPLREFTLSGYGTCDYSNYGKVIVVFNDAAYQIINDNIEPFLKDYLINNNLSTFPLNLSLEEAISISIKGKKIPLTLSTNTYLSQRPNILFNKIYANFVDDIEITLLNKTFSIKSYYEQLNDYYGDVSYEVSTTTPSNDIFIDSDSTSNCIIYLSDYPAAFLNYVSYKFNLLSTIYFDSSKAADDFYNNYHEQYEIYSYDSRYQVSEINDSPSLYVMVSTCELILGLTIFLVVILSLTSPILNMVLRKYNPDFGVMQTLGFSQKILFSIRLLLIEIPLILTYLITSSIIVPTIFVTIANSYRAYWYIFVIISLLVLFFAFILCLNFYLKEKKRSMRQILKDAGGK